MKLRFDVDQAESFRQGVDYPKSTHVAEILPKDVDVKLRELIAKRMIGIDVCKLTPEGKPQQIGGVPERIKASLPTWESFITAVKADEAARKPEP